MYNIELVLGDWSRDGHNQTESFMILSSLDCGSLERAYKKGSKLVGFNLSEQVCHGYEDNEIDNDHLDKLISLGFNASILEQYEYCKYTNVPIQLSTNDFYMIYMFIARLGNPELKYESLDSESINIGGYGLFNVY
jgi:hypothetical protein